MGGQIKHIISSISSLFWALSHPSLSLCLWLLLPTSPQGNIASSILFLCPTPESTSATMFRWGPALSYCINSEEMMVWSFPSLPWGQNPLSSETALVSCSPKSFQQSNPFLLCPFYSRQGTLCIALSSQCSSVLWLSSSWLQVTNSHQGCISAPPALPAVVYLLSTLWFSMSVLPWESEFPAQFNALACCQRLCC